MSSVSSVNAFKRLQTQLSLPDLTTTNLANQSSVLQNTAKNQPVCFAESKVTTSTVTTNVPIRTTTSTGSLPHAVLSESEKIARASESKYKSSMAKRDRFSPVRSRKIKYTHYI